MSPRMARRGLLSGAAASAALAAVPVTLAAMQATSADAELLATLAAFDQLERERQALYRSIEDDNERELLLDPIDDRQEPLLDRLCELQATTPEAHRARAATLALWDGELFEKGRPDGYWPARMTAALVRDLIGPAAAAAFAAGYAQDVAHTAERAAAQPSPLAPVVPPGDDAAIVEHVTKIRELKARIDRLSAEQDSLPGGDPGRQAYWVKIDALGEELWPHRVVLPQLQATTLHGFRAKAWVAREFSNADSGLYFDPAHDEAVAFSLAGDLLGLPAQKVPDDAHGVRKQL